MANHTNWLNISSQSGSSGQTILTLSANKNLSTNYKTAEITAYNPVYNVSAKTYVTIEAYSPFLSLNPTLFGVPDTGGTYELTINANCPWVIAFPDLVSSYSTTGGSGTTTVTFTVPSTSADTTLVGNIVVTDESGQISRIARIEQYGAGVHIGIFPVELYFDSTGGSKTFTVTADCAYQVSMNNTPWATVSPNSGYTGQTTFTVTVNNENTGTTDLVGAVNIDAPGEDLSVIIYQRKPETRLVVGYYVTSTTDPTVLMYSGALSSVSQMEYPDGTQITPATAYTFPSTGMQYVYYTLTGGTVPYNMFNGGVGYMNDRYTVREVYVPNGISVIGGGAFKDCFNLSSVTLPDSLKLISEDAFGDCSNLEDVVLPEGLLTIMSRAFSGCGELATIIIPSSVGNILSYAFTSTKTFYFSSATPPTLGTDALGYDVQQIIVPCVYVNNYVTAWPQYAQYISCQDDTTLYFVTDTSNVKGIGETRTITILNTNINPNRTGLNLPSDFPQQGAYTVVGNTIYLTYPRNPSSSATRTWVIGVVGQTNDGVNLSGSYTITQDANVTYLIPYTADTSTVDASGETRTITIDTSNLVASSITIGVEGATGVSYTYQNGVITITFPENTGDELGNERTVVITITAITTDGKDAYASISYTQDYNYTGETRVFVIYEQSYNRPTKISYTKCWTKVELADGTDITEDVIARSGEQEAAGEWSQSGYGYNFGLAGNYGVYLTIPGNTIGAYAFDTCYKIKLVDIPNYFRTIYDEAFSNISGPTIISFGKGLTYFGRAVFRFSAIQKLLFKSQAAPELYPGIIDSYSNLFYNINSGGTLLYPCGSDYSTYVDILENSHSWSSACITESGTPTSSYTYSAFILGNMEPFNGEGETRTFKVGCLTDTGNTFSYSISGPSGTSYTYTGDSITVTVPYNSGSSIRQVTIYTTATSYDGALVGTGEVTLEQLLDDSSWTIATYAVTSTTTPTKILGNNSSVGIYASFPDGSERMLEARETEYTFQETGTQIIKYQMLFPANILGGGMFDGVPNLLSVSISTAITQISNGCFSNCDLLSAVSIPNSVTAISYSTDWQSSGQYCFENCPSLQTIVIPDSVVYISCFKNYNEEISTLNCRFCNNCASLTSVTMGSGISSSIRFRSPFASCPNLTNIYMYPATAPDLSSSTILGLSNTGTLYYPAGSDYSSWLTALGSGWTGVPI